jgi:hypothetical protein
VSLHATLRGHRRGAACLRLQSRVALISCVSLTVWPPECGAASYAICRKMLLSTGVVHHAQIHAVSVRIGPPLLHWWDTIGAHLNAIWLAALEVRNTRILLPFTMASSPLETTMPCVQQGRRAMSAVVCCVLCGRRMRQKAVCRWWQTGRPAPT